MKLLKNASTNPYYNLALEEYVLKNYLQGDYLLLWQNDNTVVVGKHQNTIAEINEQFIREQGINVVRRTTGGGAVYHDMGNINFSFVTELENAEKLTMQRFTKPIVDVLKKLGLNAETSGRNDITVDGKKVSGNAQTIYKNRILHHGTLLFDSHLSVVSSALNVKADKIQSKGIQSVRSRVCNINDYLSPKMTVEGFFQHLVDSLYDGGGELLLTENDLKKIGELEKNKYNTWEWNFGNSPEFNLKNYRKFSGGGMEVVLMVQNGVIRSGKIYGDFMALCPAEEVIEKLVNLPYEYDTVKEELKKIELPLYFGNISLQEVLDLFFNLTDE